MRISAENRKLGYAAVLAVLLALPGMSYAGKVQSFSADQVSLDPQGQTLHTGKLAMMPDKARMEGQAPDGKGTLVNIMRMDLKVHWILNPAKKAYLERPLGEESLQALIEKDVKPQQEEELGSEKVSGYKCRKKRVTKTVEIMGFKRASQSTVWVSERFDMPLRTHMQDGSMTELRNIREGKPDQALFELPPGYARVDHIMALFDAPADKPSGRKSSSAAEGGGPLIPEEVLKRLPKGIKLPFGSQQ